MKHSILYHYTKTKYLSSIKSAGLIPGYQPSPYVPQITDRQHIWLDQKLFKLKTPGWAVVSIDTTQLDPKRLERPQHGKRWYVYAGIIPASAINLVASLPE